MKLRIAFRTSCMLLLLLFMSFCSPVLAQKATNREVSPQGITTIGLTIKGAYLIIDAKLNGNIRKFILDGSSDKTLLNSKYIQQERRGTGKIKSFPGQPANKGNRKSNSIDFYGTKLNRSNIETMDMSYIEGTTGMKIYGIIGYDLIKFYDLFFNYKEHTITLFIPKEYKGIVSPPHKRKMQWMLPFIPL